MRLHTPIPHSAFRNDIYTSKQRTVSPPNSSRRWTCAYCAMYTAPQLLVHLAQKRSHENCKRALGITSCCARLSCPLSWCGQLSFQVRVPAQASVFCLPARMISGDRRSRSCSLCSLQCKTVAMACYAQHLQGCTEHQQN